MKNKRQVQEVKVINRVVERGQIYLTVSLIKES